LALRRAGALIADALLGVTEVYAVGGAQAIAMFAYGAGPCRPVDLVTGPGNIYTVSAKRLLKGVVGIDSEAGPTEIAILADDSAEPAHVAADLISQAEHDPLARFRIDGNLDRILAAVAAFDVPKVDEVPVDHQLPAAVVPVVGQETGKARLHLGREVDELAAGAGLEVRAQVEIADEKKVAQRCLRLQIRRLRTNRKPPSEHRFLWYRPPQR